MARLTFTVGRLWRRPVRRTLLREGFEFREDKGLLNSQFVVTGEAARLILLRNALRKWADEGTD